MSLGHLTTNEYAAFTYLLLSCQLPGLLLFGSCYEPMLAPHRTRTPEHGVELTSIVLIVLIIAQWSLPLRVIEFLVTAKVTLVRRRFSIDHWLGVPVHNHESVSGQSTH